tara:strand:+ start:410 stop:748 length:339 start_codon:yes stop_codon:yes gene_type:complete
MKKIIKIIILAFMVNTIQSQDSFLDFPIDKPTIQPLTSEYYRGYDKPTLGPLLTFGGGLFLTSGLLTKPPTYVDLQGNIRPLRFGKQGNRMYIMTVGSILILTGIVITISSK